MTLGKRSHGLTLGTAQKVYRESILFIHYVLASHFVQLGEDQRILIISDTHHIHHRHRY